MKWRNQLLALFCLLVFLAFGIFYFQHWVVQKPFGIILFVVEGLSTRELAAARIYSGGADHPLTLDSLPYTALLKNYSRDSATSDPAAAATAYGTGVKVKNGAIGVDAEGKALANLIELARASGRMTGVVTNGRLTSPTLASFYGHTSKHDGEQDLARGLLEDAGVDVILGGGSEFFRSLGQGGQRTDERDLLAESQDAGYDLVESATELEDIPRWRRARLFGVFNKAELTLGIQDPARTDQPSLADMVRRSIELLQFNSGGYLLVVDAALMRKSAREKNAEQTIVELLELDKAVSVALEYAGTKSAVLVCGDAEMGDLDLTGIAPSTARGDILSEPPSAPSALRNLAGGLPKREKAESSTDESSPDFAAQQARTGKNPPLELGPVAPAADENIACDVIAFGAGLGVNDLHGTFENTKIFELIRDNL